MRPSRHEQGSLVLDLKGTQVGVFHGGVEHPPALASDGRRQRAVFQDSPLLNLLEHRGSGDDGQASQDGL